VSPIEIAAVLMALGLSTFLLVSVVGAVWWFDRYDREPLTMVAGVFLWGALAAPVISVFASSSIGIGLNLDPETLIGVWGPLIEELAKAIGIGLVLVFSREFDNPTDGVVYGTASGLGFSATENLVYVVAGFGATGTQETIVVVLLRTLMSAGIHAVSSATLGGVLGFAYLSKNRLPRLLWSLAGLAGATVIHAGWNLTLLRIQDVGGSLPIGRWVVAIAALYALYLAALWFFLRSEQQILGEELAEEVELDVLPEWIVDVIPFYRRRIRSDWWPSRRERTVLARLLTRLAFRKHAVKRLPEGESDLAGLEVVQLRQRIRSMLSGEQGNPID
jgi:RsiW-degrading membrane proteinase PrsW (M82 family)